MKEQKNIDRLFQEKFRDFEFAPPERIWSHVEKNINIKTRSRRRNIFVWSSRVAAILILFFLFNSPFLDLPGLPFDTDFFNTDSTPVTTKESTDSNTDVADVNQKNTPSTPKNNGFDSADELNFISLKPNGETKFPPNKNNSNDDLASRDLLKTDSQNALLNDYNNQENNNNLTKNSNTEKGWSVTTVAAPVFLSSFGNSNSAIDSQMNENIKQGKISSAYGIQVAYQFNKRFSIQSGVHLVDFAYSTHDVDFSSSKISSLSNINYDNARVLKTNTMATMPQQVSKSNNNEVSSRESAQVSGDLTQVYGYVEIPLEAKYRLNANKDLGINIIGGFSTLLLNKNDVYFETSEFTNRLGEASNLNTVNFSGNLGVELEYKVYKNVNFNLVPMFKIQTQTLNNTNAFKPYSVGLYSGLNLRF